MWFVEKKDCKLSVTCE